MTQFKQNSYIAFISLILIMEILQDRHLAKYLFQKYCSNPKNWKFLLSPSSFDDGFFDATISNLDEVWQIKVDSIFKPVPLILGTKIDSDATKVYKQINTAPFGYRKIDLDLIMNVLSRAADEKDVMKPVEQRSSADLTTLLSAIEPVRPSQRGTYAYGPLAFSNVNPFARNDQQKFVSEKLSRRLRQVLRDRYSLYG
jgi:hypothetical protein